MSDIVISVQGLSKQYLIGARQTNESFREALRHAVTRPFRGLRAKLAQGKQSGSGIDPMFWALKNVSFEVKAGEILGLVGRNGAGKSTLLKILSRITPPSEGRAVIKGRVRSLLEVGTGFHPELTGRENIFLNGAILGMKKSDIHKRFDEIVEFAGIEQFIDTPVKRYSSGMYLRLAFAVAAHLVSEVLFVDEVLAVGDATFQKKCVGRMNEVAREGRTVIFVSHNLAAVRTLCTRGVLLDRGEIVTTGPVERVLYHYTQNQRELTTEVTSNETRFTSILVNGHNPGSVPCGEQFELTCTLQLAERLPGVRLFCVIQDANGEEIIVAPCEKHLLDHINVAGSHPIRVRFPSLWLRPGVYNAYFKFLVSAVDIGKARFLSDNIMLDVTGTDDPEMLMGALSPATKWEAESPVAALRETFALGKRQ